jgi:hypothetical protein
MAQFTKDTARIDTSTVNWPAPDSVMQALMARTGYDVTRFQGARVTFDEKTKALRLDASKSQRAAVDRNGQTMVSDSTIYYNQATNTTTNEGCYTLNFPGSTEAPIRGCGRVSYDASTRGAQFTNAKVPFNNGEMWYLDVRAGAAQIDSTGTGPRCYPSTSRHIRGCSFSSRWRQAPSTSIHTCRWCAGAQSRRRPGSPRQSSSASTTTTPDDYR